ncbi:tetratricopeptide repeat-containing sensor histidine kinase [Pedobacter cryophilus]|uniref:Oxygen sensor histidine kinase NreB n=1 Tax=Pedobacter cryophilus TaxID=2571271 RepID=A0A4U1BSS9_9SPHI|nr:tetratricopeptide repeat protein [Pedobacter cryophilus]TKB95148.1 tetratricopeptide repeat protein [Pedobacter cryophilus]
MKFFALLLFLFPVLIIAAPISKDSLQIKINAAKSDQDKITIYQNYGLEFSQSGDFKKSIECFNQVVKIARKKKSIEIIASAYNEIGNSYADMGENSKALKYYQEALKVLGDKDFALQAKINKNIGALFLSWKKLDQALNYYNIAEELAIKVKDERTVADLANNKGTVYEQQNLFFKASESYQKALNFYLKENISDRICLTYNNLAILYKVKKDFIKSAAYYKKSVEYADKANNKWLTAAIGNNLGNLLSEMGQYAESEQYLKKALKLENEIEAKELIPETLENLAQNEQRRGDFKQAYNYQQQFSKAQDQFINLENTKEVSRLQEQFDATNKQKKIELLNKESKIQQLTLSKRNNTIAVITFFFIAIAFISSLIFSRYKLKQESKFKLATVETKNQIQEEKLRISRELHDNIGSQLSFINSAIQNINDKNPADTQLIETQKIAQNTIRELRSTVWLINQQEFSLEEFIIKLRDYVKPYHNGKPHITVENLTVDHCILQPITATNLFRIIQEGVNNAIKHADSTALNITISGGDKNDLSVNISDNGKGYDLESKPSGYGLKNIKSRIETLGGQYSIKTGIGKGTAIQINIPI